LGKGGTEIIPTGLLETISGGKSLSGGHRGVIPGRNLMARKKKKRLKQKKNVLESEGEK